MKTINKSEYDALPEERQKYWKENSLNTILSGDIIINYTPIQINLEDAERVLEQAREIVTSLIDKSADEINFGLLYTQGRNTGFRVSASAITQAINNLKQLTK